MDNPNEMTTEQLLTLFRESGLVKFPEFLDKILKAWDKEQQGDINDVLGC